MALITDNANLQAFNTLGLICFARGLAQPNSLTELTHILSDLNSSVWQGCPLLMLGSGSNIVFINDYPGVILKPRWSKIEIIDETNQHLIVRVGAGHNWHRLVQWHLQKGLSGLENMALIPGSVGAAPIQNIGAYGVEFSSCCQAVEVFDLKTGNKKALSATECKFQYRHSLFKTPAATHWLITHIILKLNKKLQPTLTYPGLQSRLNVTTKKGSFNATDIAAAVCHIRQQKLPDPNVIGNVGSFFKNPIISNQAAELLLEKHPKLPYWPINNTSNHVKISAAWLIEKAGWKGKRDGDIGIYPKHALVLINYGNASGKDLWTFAQRLQTSVAGQFNINLEIEPRIIGVQTAFNSS